MCRTSVCNQRNLTRLAGWFRECQCMAHNCLKYMIVLPKLTFEGLKRPLRCKLSMKHIGLQGPRGHGVGLEGHRGSRGRPTGSQGVKV